ncbi:hypothetical protein LX15_004883 [Streptoalloteichus tenebrarius]|uniref:Uncharacterized protein n=1 Tax=Streptoalloteichus tenebrarius (strain ATCC 17920 / DSM 40477 / JCM 4838 / CBS 697.72 / NBRC 16177 / NCIMB 11028 / NRRL B-12390 / A12253. 1 / ISP 5477) TaxID=1933 RepID=A0ABT1I048_STRSD|nr:hypothetical protein [Streptoalloteichus tenebrarius]
MMSQGDLVATLRTDERDACAAPCGLTGASTPLRDHRLRPDTGMPPVRGGQRGCRQAVAAVAGCPRPDRVGPGSDQDPHRQSTSVDREVDRGARSAPGLAEPFPADGEGLDPDSGSPLLRAPAAWWRTRTRLESTLVIHSIPPTASSWTMTRSTFTRSRTRWYGVPRSRAVRPAPRRPHGARRGRRQHTDVDSPQWSVETGQSRGSISSSSSRIAVTRRRCPAGITVSHVPSSRDRRSCAYRPPAVSWKPTTRLARRHGP